MNWKVLKDEKPTESGLYEVKTTILPNLVRDAYYCVVSNCWIDDDGLWLPVVITPYVTHWTEKCL